MPFRDSSDRTLLDYPRPSLAVDTAVLTVSPTGELSVLVIEARGSHHAGERLLPGGFVHERERLDETVLRTLQEKAGVSGLAPSLLGIFDDPARDDRGWVIAAAYLSVVPWNRLAGVVESRPSVTVVPARASAGLPFDHDAIVARAVAALTTEYAEAPDPRGLLTEPFTLLELQRLHAAVAGAGPVKDTFRRRMLPDLHETGEVQPGVVGKPARLFVRA